MNDPGLDDPIQQASQDVENVTDYRAEESEEDEEEDFLDPSRWWFASTACPLVAGTFGPMANAFSICALVQSWREDTPPGAGEDGGTNVPDPAWLIGVNAVSLALALIANFALLLNMARRLPFAIAQPITIIGWFIAAFLLIALVAVANSSLFRIEPYTDHALTQAFYYAIIAAALYCIISSLMVVTVVGAYRGHYKKEFRLTTSQRTLMLQTIAFMVYLLVGALIFSTIEGWKYLDAVYWADFTLLTIGIGDFSPNTTVGRGLLFPFAIGGVVTLGLVIGSIRSLVLERGKHKLAARITEKQRESTLRSVNMDKRTIRVGLLGHYKFSEEGLTESQRRQQEFLLMRKIQEGAQDRRRWMSLALSSTVAAGLWFGGAGVFAACERNTQDWDYFISLYFSFTSLLTIGYGDFYPASNAGKPVFVFWSLLAVPALTVLISNMGDTVIKMISDLTIWAGSLTVLPGEKGFKAQYKATLRQLVPKMQRLKARDFSFAQPPGILPYASDDHGRQKHHKSLEDLALNRVGELLDEEDIERDELKLHPGDLEHRDLHLWHYILSREVRKLTVDMLDSSSKQYSYAEWAYYLRLIGQDEGDESQHRAPPVAASRKMVNGRNVNAEEAAGAGQAGGKGSKKVRWSWLGTRSPLMASKSESEWLVDRLGRTLEKEMANVRRRGLRNDDDGSSVYSHERVPASVRALLQARRERRDAELRGDRRTSDAVEDEKEELKKEQ